MLYLTVYEILTLINAFLCSSVNSFLLVAVVVFVTLDGGVLVLLLVVAVIVVVLETGSL
jgi:hypothetical protein